MKCYTVQFDKVLNDIDLYLHDRFGPCIKLGDFGRDNRFEFLSFYKKKPPDVIEVSNGLTVSEFHPITVSINTKDGGVKEAIALAKPKENMSEDYVILRINTRSSEPSNSLGYYVLSKGRVITLGEGWGYTAKNGEMSRRWVDTLLQVERGSQLLVNFQVGDGFKQTYINVRDDNLGIEFEEVEEVDVVTGGV